MRLFPFPIFSLVAITPSGQVGIKVGTSSEVYLAPDWRSAKAASTNVLYQQSQSPVRLAWHGTAIIKVTVSDNGAEIAA